MQRSPHRFLASSAGALVLAAAFSCTALPSIALAAELGDVVVRSHIGQQLSADIELVMLTPEDQAGVQVKLAGQNIYLGANVRMHPALSSLRMSVVKRDNRQFLHLTTLQPLDAELVHLFLELGTGSRASVRSATLWLTPEPPPLRTAAPAPAPGSAPAAALAGPSAAAPRSPAAPSSVADTGVGPAAAPSAAERAAQEAQAAANRAAAIRAARMRAAANAARDAGADTVSTAPAAAEVKPGPAAVPIKLGPEPRVARSKTGAAKAAACAPGQPDGEAQQCVALDQTNAELKTKLVDLEDKVKQLQAALAQGGTTAAAPAAGAGAAAAGPAAAPAPAPGASATAAASAAASAPEAANKAGTVIPPATPPAKANGKKKREAGGVNTTTMVVGGVLLLALLGGLLAYLIRRKKIKFSTEPLKVWQGWRKNKSAAAPEAAAEAEAIPEKE